MTHLNSYRILLLASTLLCAKVWAQPVTIELPPETAEFKASPHPGRILATQKCVICHSADYVNLQPGHMSLTQWTAEMNKMQHAYGAPLSTDDIQQISEYLTLSYGDAKSVTNAVPSNTKPEEKAAVSLTASATSKVSATTATSTAIKLIDAKSLLNANACLGCHAIDKKIVGPAYQEVAAHYRSDSQALSKVEASIRNGGSGKWGAIPMPAYPKLSPDELKTLATYILKL